MTKTSNDFATRQCHSPRLNICLSQFTVTIIFVCFFESAVTIMVDIFKLSFALLDLNLKNIRFFPSFSLVLRFSTIKLTRLYLVLKNSQFACLWKILRCRHKRIEFGSKPNLILRNVRSFLYSLIHWYQVNVRWLKIL